MDGLIKCAKCGGNFCYENFKDNIVAWNCISCGYQSNSFFMDGSPQITSYEETVPELIKDIKFVDKDGFVWYPTIINLPNKGVIFPDGESASSWKWAYAPAVPVPYEEKERFKIQGEKDGYYSHKIDMRQVKHYERHEFSKALQEAGLI